ncbi:BTAD domain-containing putative transcriptional regulator [Streptosporangium soli]|nr:tetratricopeptide repeat protein [Streptosporangium sp. KLBMP 9127]
MTADRPTFNVLGPLDVRSTGHLGGTKPRMLLATLLLHANRMVGAELLVEALWPARQPRSAAANVRTYVSSLRRALGDAGTRLHAGRSGYMIELQPGDLDLLIFEELTVRARGAQPGGEPLELLRRALALWRGDPLSDLPGSPLWDARLEPLREARLTAAEHLLDLRTACGQQAEAVAEARGLLVDHPFREGLWQRLMAALHRDGRQAEALSAYATIRERLIGELGIEPGAGLRQAHAAVLAGDPAPGTAHHHGAPSADGPVPSPHQLPPDIPDFTGRKAEVALLTGTLSGQGPPVVVVTGGPGVGKSALAVHCAHAVRAECPDGQLFLDLGGTSAAPPQPAELLAEVLRALGVRAVPYGMRERAVMYRSLLAERRMLLLLDDAASAAQVRPLLPGDGCPVLVTSRRRITELPGAVHVGLDVLPPGEAAELFGRIVGAGRMTAEGEATAAILRACGHLPLAVRIAGARLAARPDWPLRVLERRLRDESHRLGELRVGDLEVRASFELSYRQLPGDAAAALRTLGLLGAESFPGWVVDAALNRDRADQVVDTLVDANLVQLAGSDLAGQPRYRLSELIGFGARERAGPADGQALARVFGAWLAVAEHATERLPTRVFSLTATAAPRWIPSQEVLTGLTADPLTWFDVERDTLSEAVRLAAAAGLPGAAWELAASLVPYFDLRSHYDDWRTTHRIALDAVRAAGDRRGEAALLRGLAQVSLYQDAYGEAAEMFTRSHMIFREVGDRRGEAVAVCGLGAVNQFSGDHTRALGRFTEALAMFLDLGDPVGEAFARQALGRVCLDSGDLPAAAHWLAEALRLARELGDRHREGCVSIQVGRLHDLGANVDGAMRFQGLALDIFEDLGDSHCAAYALRDLGRLQAVRGDLRRASAQLKRSLTIFKHLGDRMGEAGAVRLLGELHHAAGDADLAKGYLHQASALQHQLSAAT